MPVYTLVGDPHAKPDNLDKIERLFAHIESLGNPCIILGDLLDTKEVVRARCLNTYIRRIKASALEFIILVGNHDLINLESVEHSLEALKLLKNVTVVDVALVKGDLLFIPYLHDPAVLKTTIAACRPKPKTIFCHADIISFDLGTGHISTSGAEPKDFGQAKVISGHYHAYQSVGNITYLGTPFSHSFGETDQDKYLGVYDTETQALELIPTGFPRHLTLNVDCNDTQESREGAEAAVDLINHGNYVRCILTGTQDAINAHPRVAGVKYIERADQAAKQSLITEADSNETQFVKWAKDLKGYNDDLVELGLEVLKNV